MGRVNRSSDWVRDLPSLERRWVQALRGRIYSQAKKSEKPFPWRLCDRLAGKALDAWRLVNEADRLKRAGKRAEYLAVAAQVAAAHDFIVKMEALGGVAREDWPLFGLTQDGIFGSTELSQEYRAPSQPL